MVCSYRTKVAWEKFKSKSIRRMAPFVSVRTDGRMRFNSDATKKLLSLGVLRLDLLWDRDRGRVGFRPAPEDDRSAYKLTFSRAQNSADIAVKAFLKHAGYVLKEKLDLPLEWDEKEGMFEAKFPRAGRKAPA